MKTRRYAYAPVRTAKIQNTVNTKCGAKRNPHLLWVGTQNGTATLEDSLAVSHKTKHTLTRRSDSRAPWRTVILLNELKIYSHTKTCS